jgi:hypothetical protein
VGRRELILTRSSALRARGEKLCSSLIVHLLRVVVLNEHQYFFTSAERACSQSDLVFFLCISNEVQSALLPSQISCW